MWKEGRKGRERKEGTKDRLWKEGRIVEGREKEKEGGREGRKDGRKAGREERRKKDLGREEDLL